MSEDEVGYGKPPKHSRFKPGNNANPKGRPKRKPAAIAEIIDNVLDGRAEYRERGRTKKATRRELTVKSHVKRALGGDLKSIEAILLLRAHAQTSGDTGGPTARDHRLVARLSRPDRRAKDPRIRSPDKWGSSRLVEGRRAQI
jgi:Family of unknown function (DUF5681)